MHWTCLQLTSAANILQLDKDAEGVEERVLHKIVLASRKRARFGRVGIRCQSRVSSMVA